MKCAFSCSSRFYTAYRTFQFSGHLRKSTIQEGREEKNVNTLVVFTTPLNTISIGNNESSNVTTTAVTTKEEIEEKDTVFPSSGLVDRKEL